MEIREHLQCDKFYHICIKANGNDAVFRDTRDYLYFIRKMDLRLCEAWEIIAFTLLPQEAHFAVRIAKGEIDGEQIDHSMLLSHLLNGYVQHYNYKYQRTGSLLQRSFRREHIKDKKSLQELVCKIHNLPVAQQLVEKPEDWEHCSFQKSSKQKTWGGVRFADVVKLFGSLSKFRECHADVGLVQVFLCPPKFWKQILTPLEVEFRRWNPLGVHRWCKRVRTPP